VSDQSVLVGGELSAVCSCEFVRFAFGEALDLRHAVHILPSGPVRTNADSSETALYCILEVRVEADLGEVTPANMNAVEVAEISRRLVTLVLR